MTNIMQNRLKIITISFVVTIFFYLCPINIFAETNLNTIPVPAKTPKISIAEVIVTGPPLEWWPFKHEDYVTNVSNKLLEFLDDTKLKYEIVSVNDIEAVLGKAPRDIEESAWLKDNCDLLTRLGRTLHADYIVIISRTREIGLNAKHKMVLINVKTNTQYSTSSDFAGISSGEFNLEKAQKEQLITLMFKYIFTVAKDDLWATALRKGQSIPK